MVSAYTQKGTRGNEISQSHLIELSVCLCRLACYCRGMFCTWPAPYLQALKAFMHALGHPLCREIKGVCPISPNLCGNEDFVAW